MDDARTYDPTPQRRKRAAEAGQVARSAELSAMAVSLIGLIALTFVGARLVEWLAEVTVRHLQHVELTASADGMVQHLTRLAAGLGELVLPLLALLVVCAVAVELLQVGVRFNAERILPDVDRLNPARNWGRLFSLDALARSLLAVGKVAAVGAVLYWSIKQHLEHLVSLPDSSPVVIAVETGQFALWTAIKAAGTLLAVAGFDYLYRRWKHEQDLKMTSEELREELRELHGDPQLAARRRATQAEAGVRPPPAI